MSTTITIYADGDLERLEELYLAVVQARLTLQSAGKDEAGRFGEDHAEQKAAVDAAEAAYEAFVDEAAERAQAWELDTIGHAAFRQLLRDHPPRMIDNPEPGEGKPAQVAHPDDEEWKVNVETFGEALLLYVDREDPDLRTITEPSKGVAAAVKRLSLGQFDHLWRTAYNLNRSGVIDPKALRSLTAATSPEIWT